MPWSGSALPGLRAASLASFHLLILPRNTSASTGPVTRSSPGLKPSRLITGTVPPMIAGNCTMPSFSRSAPDSGAEGQGFGADLANAARRAYRLIVQSDAGFLFVGFSPFGVHREREGCACARDVRCQGRADGAAGQCDGNDGNGFEKYAFGFHQIPFDWSERDRADSRRG